MQPLVQAQLISAVIAISCVGVSTGSKWAERVHEQARADHALSHLPDQPRRAERPLNLRVDPEWGVHLPFHSAAGSSRSPRMCLSRHSCQDLMHCLWGHIFMTVKKSWGLLGMVLELILLTGRMGCLPELLLSPPEFVLCWRSLLNQGCFRVFWEVPLCNAELYHLWKTNGSQHTYSEYLCILNVL